MQKIVIVVLGFNRPASLRRLLSSLENVAPSSSRADIVISIDGEGDPNCICVAESFKWIHGATKIVCHQERMGLKRHVETATDRVDRYDAIIILEDDLTVSPYLLRYASQVLKYYGDNEEIAQFSLYRHVINEFSGTRFDPIACADDCWFARVPSSCGQMYTRIQWQKYREWQQSFVSTHCNGTIPLVVKNWMYSWKREFFNYVSANKLWVVYPYTSLTTNHGDAGANHPTEVKDLHAPLEVFPRVYKFAQPNHSLVRYDEWFEPLPGCLGLPDEFCGDIAIDLTGAKRLDEISAEYILSVKSCSDSIIDYSTELVPLELNIRLNVRHQSGRKLSLGKASAFEDGGTCLDIACESTARGVSGHLYSKGVSFGHMQVRNEIRYRIGNAVCAPINYLRRLSTVLFEFGRNGKSVGRIL